jgi:polysaccharide biosynthesis protein PslH
MKCLWLTLADPDPPMNGQFLYSSGLIRAAATAGVDLDVVGFGLPEGTHRDGEQTGTVHWHLAPHRPRSRWWRIVSRWPGFVDRTRTRYLRRLIGDLISDDQWEAVVLDSISLAWAVPLFLSRYGGIGQKPKLIYLAHNHEETLAWHVARCDSHPIKRLLKHLDAMKMKTLERAVSRHACLIASNTPDDCEKFLRKWPDKPVEFLPPGYSGIRVPARRITSQVPRRAIIVGSFDWVAKRQSLVEFLDVADRLFAAAGAELYVVGQADEAFMNRQRRRCSATRFTGRVDDVAVYMKEARIGLVPDRMEGFKLKGLDYVFNRLPIFAISGSLPGMPLRHGQSIAYFSGLEELALAVLRSLEDFGTLNALQERAYAACAAQFDWSAIGHRLSSAIARAGRPWSEGDDNLARLAESIAPLAESPAGSDLQRDAISASIACSRAAGVASGRKMKL